MLCLNPALAQRDNWDWRPLEKEDKAFHPHDPHRQAVDNEMRLEYQKRLVTSVHEMVVVQSIHNLLAISKP